MAKANTSAVQMLITINGKSVTAKTNKKNVVSLKVSRVLGDAANKFTLELFDETAWKLESAMYKTKNTPISIQYGATGDWKNGKHVTFTGICTNYNLSFVGAATMLAIEGVIYSTEGVAGVDSANFWFKNETVCWVDCEINPPNNIDTDKQYNWKDNVRNRARCTIDGKKLYGSGGLDQGFEDIINGEYADYICARIDWIPPEKNDKEHWDCRPLINPTNIFKRIIRKYNGELGTKYEHTAQDWDDDGNVIWYDDDYGRGDGYGNFQLGECDESLWIDATNYMPGLTQTNTTAADFITNVLCKIAVKPGSKSAGFKYYIKDGKHCFKAIDYSSKGENKVVKTGYYTPESDIISFSLNQTGALVMAGADRDENGNALVDTSALDVLTGSIITTQGYFLEGQYVSEDVMSDEQKTNSNNWYFKKLSGIKVVSSSSQNLLNVEWSNAFNEIAEYPLSASMTVWGEYNNKYIPR